MGPVRSLAFSGSDTLLCGDDGNNIKAFVSLPPTIMLLDYFYTRSCLARYLGSSVLAYGDSAS